MHGMRGRLGRLEQLALTPVITGDAKAELVRRLNALAARMATHGEGRPPDDGGATLDEVKGRLRTLLEKAAV